MNNFNKIPPQSNKYLQVITEVDSSVKSLCYMGKLPDQRQPSVAIVGSRKPTTYGKEIAYKFAYELAKRGVIIISGLALGIDGIVHQAALDAGGVTIAVVPCSLHAVHPRSHRELAWNIIQRGGLLLSEYENANMVAYKSNCLARNRIESGLSDGVLIIEAASRSGTLNTARHALNQGKPVMAVPGNITSPMSVGCNNLIKSGAKAITDIDDILEEIGLAPTAAPAKLPLAYTPEEYILIKLLADGTRDGEELQQQSGLAPDAFSQTLTMLEIGGKVRALGANQWAIK